jgi:hypothetical protein
VLEAERDTFHERSIELGATVRQVGAEDHCASSRVPDWGSANAGRADVDAEHAAIHPRTR